MKSFTVLVLALLGRGLASMMAEPDLAGRSFQRLSLLDRRLQQSTESRLVTRDDYTCGPGSELLSYTSVCRESIPANPVKQILAGMVPAVVVSMRSCIAHCLGGGDD